MTEFKLDFVGLGAARCGTTWLTKCLREHPQICVSSEKEIRYFNARNHLRNIPNKNHGEPFSWYMSHFDHWQPGQIRGEFSPPYLCDAAAPSLIKQRFPDVKMLVSLRNPMDRAYSGHLMRIYHGVESRPFEQAVAEHSDSIENGFYAKQLARYFELFRRDQFLIVIYEELAADARSGFRRIFEFLNVDPDLVLADETLRTKVNPTKPPKPPKPPTKAAASKSKSPEHRGLLQRMASRFRSPPPADRAAPAPKQPTQAASEPWRYPPMPPETRARLFDLYRDDIRRLEEMLDRDLSHWR